MNFIRRTIEIDAETDTRLREMAAERGQAESAVLGTIDAVVDIAGPDLDEDRRRLAEFIARARPPR